ncbi:MAG: RluA family pseudouridine synthase, partial [Patescibacteria group bacterium]
MEKTFTITSDHVGLRLDIFLQQNLSNISRNQIQKMIKDGLVTVNNKKVAPHHFLKEGDVVIFLDSVTPAPSVIPAEAGIQTVNVFPRILAETPHYLILDKPTGLTVHPAPSSRGSTLVDWLLPHYPTIRKIGDDPLRPGIVHRLDKDASGVMVVALTQESFESLIRQFKLRQVKKEYLVLVAGRVTPTEGVIDLPIGRSKKDYTKRGVHSTSVIPVEESLPGSTG